MMSYAYNPSTGGRGMRITVIYRQAEATDRDMVSIKAKLVNKIKVLDS